jgi:prophage regulatory protein
LFDVANGSGHNHPQEQSRLLRISDVQSRVSLGRSTIYAMVAKNAFPAPLKIGEKMSRWDERMVNEWIEVHVSKGIALRSQVCS